MGFTTKGEDTKRKTYHFREDVIEFVEKFAEEQGWNKSDVANRAILYYWHQYSEGELDDPLVADDIIEGSKDIGGNDGDRSIMDLLKRRGKD